MLQLKWITVRGWSKSIKADGHKYQDSRYPQKWDLQGVDKYNVGLPIPCSESLPTKVHSQIYTLEENVGGQRKLDDVPE